MSKLKAVIVSGTSRPALRRRLTSVLAMVGNPCRYLFPAGIRPKYLRHYGRRQCHSPYDQLHWICEKSFPRPVSTLVSQIPILRRKQTVFLKLSLTASKWFPFRTADSFPCWAPYGGTVADVLQTLRITLGENDRISLQPGNTGLRWNGRGNRPRPL